MNISNQNSTNIFQPECGVLNIAPIKISGQYKLVVALDGNIYFDDYTGRRIVYDKTKSFTSQVSAFLQTKSEIHDNSVLRYGAFQKSTLQTYHIPMYLGDKNYPEYFCLTKTLNQTITDSSLLYKYGNIISLISLSTTGLYDIFNQIMNEDYFDYPVYFDWLDGYIQTYGLDIFKKHPAQYTLDLQYLRANQTYFENVNNKILNVFKDNDLIFPRFINLEFEFSYSNEYIAFNNFFGFLGNSTELQSIPSDNKLYFKSKDFKKYIEWKQIYETDTLSLDSYKRVNSITSVQEIANQNPQIKYKLSNITTGSTITIYHPNSDIEFQYTIESTDIDDISLLSTLTNICKKLNEQTALEFVFSVEKLSDKYCSLKIVNNVNDSLAEDYTIEVPLYFQNYERYSDLDNVNKFRGITNTDIWLTGNPTLLANITTVSIDDITYEIVEKYYFNGKIILRLDKEIVITGLTNCIIYENDIEKFYELSTIPFFTYNTDLKCLTNYDQDAYVQQLQNLFGSDLTAWNAIQEFNKKSIKSVYQYAKDADDNSEIIGVDNVTKDNYNTEQVLNMIFFNGFTTFLTPNTLNFAKDFYLQNGNIDINQLEQDFLKYNWFLIKANPPLYLQNDIRKFRYFTEQPLITSKLIKNGDLCETVFLGVKYQLPIQYEGFDFAVYLSFDNKLDTILKYTIEEHLANNKVYLVINKYLDFIDLLRGANDKNPPLLDLSFFYSVTKSLNSKSENFESFESSSIILCSEEFKTNPIQFNGVDVYDWKYQSPINGDWYVALQLNEVAGNINDFTEIFTAGQDATFYFYSKVVVNGTEYTFASATIKLNYIIEISQKYLWCSDIEVTFFDTKQILVSKYNEITGKEDVFYPEKILNNILNVSNTNIFGHYEQTADIIVNGGTSENFKLIAPTETLSFKKYYFEINQNQQFDDDVLLPNSKSVFTFPQSYYEQKFGSDNYQQQILDIFDSPEINTPQYIITLFDRNQIWKVLKDLFLVDLKFKNYSETTVRRMIDEFTISHLIDFSSLNSIEISNPEGSEYNYVKVTVPKIDYNLAIWEMLGENKITLFNRIQGCYSPYLQLLQSEIDFQIPTFSQYSSLFNIYDNSFGGQNISATGLWSEVQGNIVSSLYCKQKDIEIAINDNTNQTIDISKILLSTIQLEDCIINNKNIEYLSKINKNVDSYIKEQYCKYLIENFYKLNYILDSNNQKLKFTSLQNNKIKLDSVYTNLIFVFSRK